MCQNLAQMHRTDIAEMVASEPHWDLFKSRRKNRLADSDDHLHALCGTLLERFSIASESAPSDLSQVDANSDHRRLYIPLGGELGPTASQGCAQLASCEIVCSNLAGGLVSVGAQSDSNLILAYPVRGAINTWRRGNWYPLPLGEPALCLPGDVGIGLLKDATQITVRFLLDGATRLRLKSMRSSIRGYDPRPLNPADAEVLTRLICYLGTEIGRQAESHPGGQRLAARLGALLAEELDAILRTRFRFPPCEDDDLVQICKRVDTFISQHMFDQIQLEDLASAGLCSVRQLHRAFDSSTFATPADYLQRRRLMKARSWFIVQPDPEEIPPCPAHIFGFSSVAKLNSAYLAEFGETTKSTAQERRRAVLDAMNTALS